MKDLQIGYLLRSTTTSFEVGCSVSQFEAPQLGSLILAPLGAGYQVYGLIHDIHIDDDGLVRQLVTADNISLEVMRDNRERRIVPVEMSVLAVGWEQDGRISHLLPPKPPLSLDIINLCVDDELTRFTGTGRFGYFRHVLGSKDVPVGEILAAHIQQAGAAHVRNGNPQWIDQAVQELITLLRDDYPTLMVVLSALSDAIPS
jgi:hypothetical protein